jgi:uncharacterized delta-60 repeat protein
MVKLVVRQCLVLVTVIVVGLHVRLQGQATFAPGDVDLGFDAGPIGFEFGSRRVDSIVVQPEGKIIIGGFFSSVAGTGRHALARLHPDGTLDTSFAPPFSVGFDVPSVHRMVLQPDGKIVVAGRALIVGNRSYSLVRLDPDGSLDPTFTLLQMSVSRGVLGLALQPDGRILIGGDFSSIGTETVLTIARLNANGTLDPTFNIGVPLGNYGGAVYTIVRQPDGNILAGGSFFVTVGGTLFSELVRLGPNGGVDTTFQPVFNRNEVPYIRTIALRPAGDMYVGGAFSSLNGSSALSLVRLTAGGALDPAFHPNLLLTPREIEALLLQDDGRLLVTGNFVMPGGRQSIARLDDSGVFDSFYPPFGLGTQFGGGGIGHALAIQPDRHVLVGGEFIMPGGVPREAIVRLLNDAPVNSPPDAQDDSATTSEDAPVTIGVLSNDSDPDGDPLTIAGVTQGANGSVVDNGMGTLTYTPNPNFNGIDTFTSTVGDGSGHTDTATVTVTVIAVNDPPLAADDSDTTTTNTPLAVGAPGVLANDSDPDSTALSAVLVTAPASGSLSLNADGSFSYAPVPGFVGTDTFTYRADDGAAASNVATVTISVALPTVMLVSTSSPVPGGTGMFTGFPQPPAVSGNLSSFLGLGSSSQQGVYVCARSAPTEPCQPVANLSTTIPNGTGTFTGLGTVSSGGSFTTFIGTGAGQAGIYSCETAMPGDPCVPIADLGTAIPGGTGTFTGFLDVAESGAAASFIATGNNQSGVYGCKRTPGDPCQPIATINTPIPGGTGMFAGFTAVAMAPGTANPNPSSNRVAFVGTGAGQAGVYSCDLAIPTDPCQPIANLSTPIPGGTGNFTGFSALSVANASVSNPSSTRVAFIGAGAGQAGVYSCDLATPVDPCQPIANLTTTIPGGMGTFAGFDAVSASLGHVAFLGQGASGQAGIYVASTLQKGIAAGDILTGKVVTELRFGRQGLDGNRLAFGATFADGSQGVFVVDVDLPANAAPVALDDAATTNEDRPVVITLLSNDSDPDGDTLRVESITAPAHGAVVIDGGGNATYTPNANYHGTDRFTYTVNDGRGERASAMAIVTIAAINDAPVAANDSYSTAAGSLLTVTAPAVLGNDSDVDSAALTAVLVTAPAQGTMTLNANGSFTYTPASGFAGTVTFTYRASDGTAGSNLATATIVVNRASNPTWRLAANLLRGGRAGHTSTLLPDGRVLVVGGFSNLIVGTTAEIFDPATGRWSPTGNLVGPGEGRASHTATLLPNGKVLVVGGVRLLGAANPTGFLRTAQLYDPATGTWTPTGSLRLSGRAGHTATLLANGTVLVVGGFSDTILGTTAEIYDPATGRWRQTGNLVGLGEGRANHTATLLPNGKVLVAGGVRLLGAAFPSGFLSTAQLYDPATGTWTPTGSLRLSGRAGHTATLLPNATVLVVGGFSDTILGSTAEIHDPTTGRWSVTGTLVGLGQGRANHTATLLPDGFVLITGGIRLLGAAIPTGFLATSQLYNPATGRWSTTGTLNVGRAAHTTTLLNDGGVLTVGGAGTAGFLASAELYGPR